MTALNLGAFSAANEVRAGNEGRNDSKQAGTEGVLGLYEGGVGGCGAVLLAVWIAMAVTAPEERIPPGPSAASPN
jgi:hypothetical protein